MNYKRLLIIILVLCITLFTLSGCTAVLLALGYSYLTGVTEPTEPTEPSAPDTTDPTSAAFRPAFRSRAFPYRR
ncbi:MAG: hypothetical protein E7461_07555 [Ruminococcaceae bacterium]|nr:hypothetical protein [Oscillospiraceae bacterium]